MKHCGYVLGSDYAQPGQAAFPTWASSMPHLGKQRSQPGQAPFPFLEVFDILVKDPTSLFGKQIPTIKMSALM